MSRGDMWGAPGPSGGWSAPGSSSWGHPGRPPTRTTNGLAVASLVLSLLWLWWVGSLAGVVFGFIALRQIKRSGGGQIGRTPAIIGLVTGLLGLAVLAIAGAGLVATYETANGSARGAIHHIAIHRVAAPAHAGSGAAQVSVKATGYTQSANGAGDLISYGVILHNQSSSAAALHVRLTVTLLDSRGRSLTSGTSTITGIPAGADFYVGGGAVTNVSLRVSSLRTAVKVGSSTSHQFTLPPVARTSVKPGSPGIDSVTGEFRNPYRKQIPSSATIYLVYLNSQGKVVGGDRELSGAVVQPGRTVSFNDQLTSLSFVKAARAEASVDPCSLLGMPSPGNCPATP